MRKAIVVGIAVAVVIAAWKNAFDVFTMLALPCAMLLLLIWGVSRLFRLLGLRKWSENSRVALALAVVFGFFLFWDFIVMSDTRVLRPAERVLHRAELNAEMQEVSIERNKVRIGMTINEVLPQVHGMDIFASAMVPAILHHKFDGGEVSLKRDGTFWYKCESASMGCTLDETKKELRLTDSQAADLMKQEMSDGYQWCWLYISRKDRASFSVTFGRDGRVRDMTGVDIETEDRLTWHPV